MLRYTYVAPLVLCFNVCGHSSVFCLQVEKIVTIMANPRQYKIPDWFLNRQKDIVDGKYSQVGLFHVSHLISQMGLFRNCIQMHSWHHGMSILCTACLDCVL